MIVSQLRRVASSVNESLSLTRWQLSTVPLLLTAFNRRDKPKARCTLPRAVNTVVCMPGFNNESVSVRRNNVFTIYYRKERRPLVLISHIFNKPHFAIALQHDFLF